MVGFGFVYQLLKILLLPFVMPFETITGELLSCVIPSDFNKIKGIGVVLKFGIALLLLSNANWYCTIIAIDILQDVAIILIVILTISVRVRMTGVDLISRMKQAAMSGYINMNTGMSDTKDSNNDNSKR